MPLSGTATCCGHNACLTTHLLLQSTPVYLASGLLSYNDTGAMAHELSKLEPYASEVFYKELFLTPEELGSLSADQESAVDYLVLTNSERFVGLNGSTFSWWVREYRKLLGHDARTSLLVATPHLDTNRLFSRAAGLPTHTRPFLPAPRPPARPQVQTR